MPDDDFLERMRFLLGRSDIEEQEPEPAPEPKPPMRNGKTGTVTLYFAHFWEHWHELQRAEQRNRRRKRMRFVSRPEDHPALQ